MRERRWGTKRCKERKTERKERKKEKKERKDLGWWMRMKNRDSDKQSLMSLGKIAFYVSNTKKGFKRNEK